MTSITSPSGIHLAAKLMREAERVVALTGAGISTPSGIPDFRSTGSGLWTQYDPMEVASLTAFRMRPVQFYRWIQPLAQQIMQAQPNAAHVAIARLEQAGKLVGVVTQNIDSLHSKAGSRRVIEIHGHLREATCVSCYQTYPTGDLMERFVSSGEIPRCQQCGGVLKPQAVLFGEEMPREAVRQARELAIQSDLMLVVGSSLEVTPAALLPVLALNTGARLIIANREPTYVDERADVLLRQDVAEILPLLCTEVIGG